MESPLPFHLTFLFRNTNYPMQQFPVHTVMGSQLPAAFQCFLMLQLLTIAMLPSYSSAAEVSPLRPLEMCRTNSPPSPISLSREATPLVVRLTSLRLPITSLETVSPSPHGATLPTPVKPPQYPSPHRHRPTPMARRVPLQWTHSLVLHLFPSRQQLLRIPPTPSMPSVQVQFLHTMQNLEALLLIWQISATSLFQVFLKVNLPPPFLVLCPIY